MTTSWDDYPLRTAVSYPTAVSSDQLLREQLERQLRLLSAEAATFHRSGRELDWVELGAVSADPAEAPAPAELARDRVAVAAWRVLRGGGSLAQAEAAALRELDGPTG